MRWNPELPRIAAIQASRHLPTVCVRPIPFASRVATAWRSIEAQRQLAQACCRANGNCQSFAARPHRIYIAARQQQRLLDAEDIAAIRTVYDALVRENETLHPETIASELVSGPKPWGDPTALWTVSPLSRAGQVKTPTLLMVGEQDRRIPVSETKQFYNALVLRRIPTALVIFPAAAHSTLGSVPSQRAEMTALTLN